MNTQLNVKQLMIASGILILGIILGSLLFGGSSGPSESTEMNQHVEEAHTDEQGNIVYTCSMHPQVRQNEPGNCPICGMELVPADNAESDAGTGDDPYTTTMTQAAMKLAQVQTATVSRSVAVKKSRMPGKVMIDERLISVIPAHFPGRIEKLYLDYTGAYVEKGDPIASVYSPELVSAQKELLEAYKNRATNPQLYEATRKKFTNWEISQEIIDRILERGEAQENFDIFSRQTGYVIKRNVAVGDHIHFGMPIFEIAELSTVWVEFEAYENDLAGISRGDEVAFNVGAYPGETFQARVNYIDPILDDQTRTVTVRAEASNSGGKLKPNMLAKGTISSQLDDAEPKLQVPASAVLWTGERSLVYVQNPNTEQPSFQAREIVLGQRVGDSYVVEEGLNEGEQVVVKGNFMIDSAAQLADKRSMMNQAPGQNDGRVPGGHNHGGEPMDSGEMQDMQSSETSATFSPGDVPAAFREQLGSLTDAYTDISSTLANDDFAKALESLNRFEQALSNIEMNQIQDPQQMQVWMQKAKDINQQVQSMNGIEEIGSFRTQFADLSNKLVETMTQFGVSQTLHLQFCPMARNQEGAYWLSKDEEIVNPYMGQKMLTCGSTEQTLQPES